MRIQVPDGKGGRQTLIGDSLYEVEAPEGERVTVEYQDIKLQAKTVRADTKKRTVVAEGDVVLEQGPTRLTGVRLDLDLAEKIGVLTDGSADLEGGLHLRGAVLAKVGPRTFTITDGTLTACDGDDPTWAFHLASGRVTLDGYARLKTVVFRFAGVPLLYTPYLLWPALQDRVSGFLVPAVGYSSDRGGFLGLSYYRVLGRSADATLIAELYTKRYTGFGLELRARPSEKTVFEGFYQPVYQQDDGRWQWQTRGILKSDDLAPKTRGVVSWIDFSDIDFFQSYNRDFNLTSTRSVKSGAFVTWTSDPFAVNLRLDRELAFYGSTEALSERLPLVEGRLRPTPLLGQRLFAEATAQGGFLKIDRGPGQPAGSYGRFDLFPRISAPLSSIPWLSLQADAGFRLTSYTQSLDQRQTALVAERYDRTYGTFGAQLTGPSFSRIFESGLGPFAKLKHVIEPRIDWSYTTEPAGMGRAPQFDEVDTLVPGNTLRYGLVQRLLGKGKAGAARDIASLEIGQTYSFSLPGGATSSTTLTKHSPVDATLRVNPSSNVNVDARTTYDFHAGQMTSASLSAGLTGKDSTLQLSLYDSRPVGAPEASTQLRAYGGLPIVKKLLRLDLQVNYDIGKGKMLESRSLLTVEGSCFKILMEYRDLRIGSVPSRDFRIGLNLKNVGSFLDFTGSVSP